MREAASSLSRLAVVPVVGLDRPVVEHVQEPFLGQPVDGALGLRRADAQDERDLLQVGKRPPRLCGTRDAKHVDPGPEKFGVQGLNLGVVKNLVVEAEPLHGGRNQPVSYVLQDPSSCVGYRKLLLLSSGHCQRFRVKSRHARRMTARLDGS
jgi:hypothetical protein